MPVSRGGRHRKRHHAPVDAQIERDLDGQRQLHGQQRLDDDPRAARSRRRRRAVPAPGPRRGAAGPAAPRLAPIASRTLISRRRAEARASSMPATLAQAMSRTRPTTAIRPAAPIDMTPPACGTSSRTSVVGTADIAPVLVRLRVGRASCRPISATFAWACCGRDAGLQPALHEHPPHAPPLERACARARRHDIVDAGRLHFFDVCDRQPQLRCQQRHDAGKRGRHADDGVRQAAQREGLADDAGSRRRTRAATSDARSPPRAARPGRRPPAAACGRAAAARPAS